MRKTLDSSVKRSAALCSASLSLARGEAELCSSISSMLVSVDVLARTPSELLDKSSRPCLPPWTAWDRASRSSRSATTLAYMLAITITILRKVSSNYLFDPDVADQCRTPSITSKRFLQRALPTRHGLRRPRIHLKRDSPQTCARCKAGARRLGRCWVSPQVLGVAGNITYTSVASHSSRSRLLIE